MSVLEIIGLSSMGIVYVFLLNKLYRRIFGYSWDSCPNDHDTMARYGATKCKKCGSDL